MKVFVLNGPNLNLLGFREPHIYGSTTLKEVEELCRTKAAELGLELDFYQTNHEGELIDLLHRARQEADGVVMNPSALTHYSFALREAVSATELPVIEVHLSNIFAREPWRAKSVVSGATRGLIVGLGITGYLLALQAVVGMIEK